MVAILVLVLFVVLAFWVAVVERSSEDGPARRSRGSFARSEPDAEEIGVLLQAL